MISMTFLALADSKTITLPKPWQDNRGLLSLSDISNLEAFGLIALFFLALYLLSLLRTIGRRKAGRPFVRRQVAPRPRKKRAPGPRKTKARVAPPAPPIGKAPALPVILIDGSNVMHWQDNTPSLQPLLKTIAELRQRGFAPGVVFDANAGHKLVGKYLHHDDLARLLSLPHDQVLVVPKGTQADPYLLETARDLQASIVSNDRYRDWADAYPEVSEPHRLIHGGVKDGEVWLIRTDKARGPDTVNPA